MSRRPIETPGYLNFRKIPYANIEFMHEKLGVPRHSVVSFSLAARTLNFDYKDMMDTIHNAQSMGFNECEYRGWTISWMFEDEHRDWLKSYDVKLGTFMGKVTGLLPRNPGNFSTKDKQFADYLFKFMGK